MSTGGPSFAELIDHGNAIAELAGALDAGQCEQIIATFEGEARKRPGVVRRPSGEEEVDLSLKRSTDYLIERDSPACWLAIDAILGQAMQRGVAAYVERYRWLPRLPTTFCAFQIQRTQPGQGFEWHADEDGRRRLALIFYLNEGFEGGETQFELQGFNYRPRRGSLLMFPPYWTHVHRGQAVEHGVKYIATAFLLHQAG